MSFIQDFKSLRRNKDMKNGFKRMYRLVWKKVSVNMPYPDTIDIEIASSCNLDCIMCEHDLRAGKGGVMHFEQFKHIIDQLRIGPRFVISGLGENLVNPDFVKIYRYAIKKGATTKFIDNFTLMTKDIARELIKTGVKTIQISFDGATKETYESIRVGANYEETLNNLKNFIDLKKEMNSKYPIITASFVLLEKNYKELPQWIELMHSYDIKEVLLHIPILYKKKELAPDYDSKDYKKTMVKARKLAKSYGMTFRIPTHIGAKSIQKCTYPFYNVFVSVEGNVFPCCHSVFPRKEKAKLSFGNLFKENFDDIWNSRRYKEFRRQIKQGNKPKICSWCVLYK